MGIFRLFSLFVVAITMFFLVCCSENGTEAEAYVPGPFDYGMLVDSRDGKNYKTIQIGEQNWMAENLNYEYNEGSGKSYCYEDNMDYCTAFGRLYNWTAAKLVCPEGWHLPNSKEWDTLWTTVGGINTAGYMLKATSMNGIDKYGFSILSSGIRYHLGDYKYVDSETSFWIAPRIGSDEINHCDFGNGRKEVGLSHDYSRLDEYRSVRCIKD